MKNELIETLIESNCIKIGNFTLKNGNTSKYYFDMKNLISYPQLLSKIGDLIYEKLDDFDIKLIRNLFVNLIDGYKPSNEVLSIKTKDEDQLLVENFNPSKSEYLKGLS